MPRQVIKDNLKDILQIKNSTETSADLFFYGDIVSSWWGAWDDTDQYPEAVKNFLDGAKGKNLNIHVNSGGGSVFAGITIYNMLKSHSGFKTVYIDGIAASIASVIALAGDKVVMGTGSSLMIHKPLLNRVGGNADELRQMAEFLDKIQECIMQVYKENLKQGIDIQTIEDMVNQETWLTNEEATKYFNIEIDEKFQAVACTSEYFDSYKNMPAKIRNEKIENVINTGLKTKESVINKNNKEEESVFMTLEELKNQYPDLYNQIFNDGVTSGTTSERNRIKAIDDLAIPGNEEIINKAKFETGITAEQTAVEIIKAQKNKGQQYLNNLHEDITNSNTNGINGIVAPQINKSKNEIDDEEAKKIAENMNKKRGLK